MEFELKIHPVTKIMYLPKELHKILGHEVTAIPNRTAILLYNKETSIDDVLAGIQIIQADLKHALEMQR